MIRVLLFIATNIAVMLMITIVMNVLGLNYYLTENGIDYTSLMVFCGLWGMGGSFISLFMSKWIAKKSMGIEIVDPNTQDPAGRDLVQAVHHLANTAGLQKMPEVGFYRSDEVNAFATGPSKNNSLVAVSTGLLDRLDKESVRGVLGHEIAHIANGDMVTMTLIQGVVNAFVMFFARIAAFAVENMLRGDDEEGGLGFFAHIMVVMAFEVAFGLIGSTITCAFSRWREYRADQGGARFAGRQNMISALERLQSASELVDTKQKAFASMKIAGAPKGLAAFFLTHPPLESRIARLKDMTYS
jgi:heat shock protein HtpX